MIFLFDKPAPSKEGPAEMEACVFATLDGGRLCANSAGCSSAPSDKGAHPSTRAGRGRRGSMWARKSCVPVGRHGRALLRAQAVAACVRPRGCFFAHGVPLRRCSGTRVAVLAASRAVGGHHINGRSNMFPCRDGPASTSTAAAAAAAAFCAKRHLYVRSSRLSLSPTALSFTNHRSGHATR